VPLYRQSSGLRGIFTFFLYKATKPIRDTSLPIPFLIYSIPKNFGFLSSLTGSTFPQGLSDSDVGFGTEPRLVLFIVSDSLLVRVLSCTCQNCCKTHYVNRKCNSNKLNIQILILIRISKCLRKSPQEHA